MAADDERPVYYAARQMTVQHLLEIIDVLRDWLRELDTEQKYSVPNGHVWNAIDVVQAARRATHE